MNGLKLKWFLYLLGVKLQYRNRTNSAFQQLLSQKEIVIQITARHRVIYHYYCFSVGQITSHVGLHPAPTLSLTFTDIFSAHRMLRHGLSDMPWLIQEINQGALQVQGDIGILLWFSSLCAHAMKIKPFDENARQHA